VETNSNVSTIMADTLPIQLDLMQRGYVDALVGQLPYAMGYQSAMTAVNVLDKVGKGLLSWPIETILGTHQLEVLRVPAGSDSLVEPATATDNTNPIVDLEDEGLEIQEQITGLSIKFLGAREMNLRETLTFEEVMVDWFEEFFRNQSIELVGAGSFDTSIDITEQIVTDTSNIIKFDQTVTFIAVKGALDPEDYVAMPYYNAHANRDLVTRLLGQIGALEGVQAPIAPPIFSGQSMSCGESAAATAADDDSSPMILAAALSAVAGAIVAFSIAALMYKRYGPKSSATNGHNTTESLCHSTHYSQEHGSTGRNSAESEPSPEEPRDDHPSSTTAVLEIPQQSEVPQSPRVLPDFKDQCRLFTSDGEIVHAQEPEVMPVVNAHPVDPTLSC